MQPVELLLTCGSELEARTIADELLTSKLIACAEIMPITSRFKWKGEIEQNEEFKLVMLSQSKYFDQIENIIRPLHSYETYVLQMVAVDKLSSDALSWLQESTE